jgi:hypothetical protein
VIEALTLLLQFACFLELCVVSDREWPTVKRNKLSFLCATNMDGGQQGGGRGPADRSAGELEAQIERAQTRYSQLLELLDLGGRDDLRCFVFAKANFRGSGAAEKAGDRLERGGAKGHFLVYLLLQAPVFFGRGFALFCV